MRHLWIGEPGQAIREDIQRGRVTEMTINMAAATSKTLWKDACKAYAKQLEAEEDPMKAASYFLMADLVEDALQVLTRAKEFEAALCIAKYVVMTFHFYLQDCNVSFLQVSLDLGLSPHRGHIEQLGERSSLPGKLREVSYVPGRPGETF